MLGFSTISEGPISQGFVASGAATPSDTTNPVLGGSVAITNITSSGFTPTWQAATDNVGVVAYELDNGSGTFSSVGNVLTSPVTGKAASTAYTVHVRAKDAAGNYSNVLTTTATTSAPSQTLDTENPAIPGTLSITNITSDGCTVSYQAGTDNVGIVGYEVSADTGTPNYIVNGTNLSKVIAGLPDSTAHTVRVRAYDAAGNRSTALTASFTTLGAIDSTVPVWSNGTSVTASNITYNSFTVTWPAATDNVGVAGYELDNGSGNYVSVGMSLTSNVSGKASSTAFTVRVRAFDSAGNRSAPISKVVTTLAAPVTTNNVVVFARNSDAPVVQQLSGLSSTPVGLTYKANAKQDLVLFNKSGSAVVVTLRGSGATTATTKGLAGVAIDLSVGLPISVPAGQFVTLMLDNGVLYLKGEVTVTASANGAVVAGVIQ